MVKADVTVSAKVRMGKKNKNMVHLKTVVSWKNTTSWLSENCKKIAKNLRESQRIVENRWESQRIADNCRELHSVLKSGH